jgi:predicted dehydrogenase/NADPH:quinone reductase-like Zn-dependent oxidoreductase
MKQILQSLKTGITEIADVPCPAVQRGQLLIRSSHTLVSAGTERMLVEFGKAGWVDKARQQPDKVRMVLDKVKTDGLLPTVEAVFNKLDQPLPLGYCNVGTVLEAGAGVTVFAVGERVVSNGKHAEAVSVPVNLCAKVPDAVTDEAAAFTVLGAIALQGIRLVKPTLGEAVVVTGLGLIGLMTVQLLRAHGCRVLGLDFDPARLALARQFGSETVDLSAGQDPLAAAAVFSRGRGVDAVLVTASTKSNEPVRQAARMCRQRGRIVLVGVAGLELSRADFFEKELSFQVSCSYGPGRYDPNYEEKGQDYPVGFVRWTEQRNFEAVLDMLADGRIDVRPLISHRFKIEDAEQAYQLVGGAEPSLGILLRYPSAAEQPEAALRVRTLRLSPARAAAGKASVAFIGAGNYATAVLIPAFKAAGARLQTVASATGVSAAHAGRKFGFEETTTATEGIFADPDISAVVVATRHNSHAQQVCLALEAGKAVFVEKPLALTLDELAQVEAAYADALAQGRKPLLMVGFNRRFAPQTVKMKFLLTGLDAPKALLMKVNAGAIPAEHWTQDREVGGGRIIGEACHFIDLLRYLTGSPIVGAQAASLGGAAGLEDSATMTLSFADGSIGTVHYLTNGHKSFPKERLEAFCGGRILQLDNFRTLKGFGWPGFAKMNLWRQDKGQYRCVAAFVHAVETGGDAPISFEELREVSRVTIELAEILAGDT